MVKPMEKDGNFDWENIEKNNFVQKNIKNGNNEWEEIKKLGHRNRNTLETHPIPQAFDINMGQANIGKIDKS